MDPSRTKEVVAELWNALPSRATSILGSETSVGELELAGNVDVPARGYVARLESSVGEPCTAFVVLSREGAIAIGGAMLMMQPATIQDKLANGSLESDDLDAIADFITQLTTTINEQLTPHIERAVQFQLGEGGLPTDEVARLSESVVARGHLKFGEFTELGSLQIAFPRRLFGSSVDATEVVGPRGAEGGGVELSPEELAAIRDTTRAMSGSERNLVLVPLGRERSVWEQFLEETGLEFELLDNVSAMRRAFDTGGCRAVIIDADVMPSGGLPALAALRALDLGPLPIVVAASSPTRTHLLRCVAAGAQAYLRKPLDVQSFVQTIQQLPPMLERHAAS